MEKCRRSSRGQSLIEVLVAMMVVALVLTAVVSVIILSIKSAQYARHKSRAAFLAQEAVEWIRSQRLERSWGPFEDLAEGGVTYCLDTLNFKLGVCEEGTDEIDSLYLREVLMTSGGGGTTVTADVTVTWFEGSSEFTSTLTARFEQYEI